MIDGDAIGTECGGCVAPSALRACARLIGSDGDGYGGSISVTDAEADASLEDAFARFARMAAVIRCVGCVGGTACVILGIGASAIVASAASFVAAGRLILRLMSRASFFACAQLVIQGVRMSERRARRSEKQHQARRART
jgi:hypothetical protein